MTFSRFSELVGKGIIYGVGLLGVWLMLTF